MKKSFSGLGIRMSTLLAGVAAAIDITKKAKPFNAPEANPIRRSGKSSGGRSKRVDSNPHYHAWKKVFGGVACLSYQG